MSHRGKNLQRRIKAERKSRIPRLIGVMAAALFGLLAAALIGGWLLESRRADSDREQCPPRGEIYEVGGLDMHMHCVGRGSPVVVLESGLGGLSLDWALVQPELSRLTTVCSYDRPGYGHSSNCAKERTAGQIADDLYFLLHRAGFKNDKYILVGHSFGGLPVRVFAGRYPEKAAGVALIDSAHEDLDARAPDAIFQANASLDSVLQLLQLAARFGLVRWAGIENLAEYSPFVSADVPEDVREEYEAELSRGRHWETVRRELDAQGLSFRQARETGGLGEIPLVVVRSGQHESLPQLTEEENREFRRAWTELQEELASLSSDSEILVAEESDHEIIFKQPEIIIEAVKKLLP